MKLDFVCPGASKSGTTTLHDVLASDPRLVLPQRKETRFFVTKESCEKGIDYYFSEFFLGGESDALWGEVCPQYMSSCDVPGRIAEFCGTDIKFIFMLRNPIDRALSHYLMKTRTFENGSFGEAIASAVDIEESTVVSRKATLEKHVRFSRPECINVSDDDLAAYRYSRYILSGRYGTFVENCLNYFPMEQMHFIIFEEFISNPIVVMESLYRFLGMRPPQQIVIPQSNKRKIYRNRWAKRVRNMSFLVPVSGKGRVRNLIGKSTYDMIRTSLERPFLGNKKTLVDAATRTTLESIYRPEVSLLEELTGLDFSFWNLGS